MSLIQGISCGSSVFLSTTFSPVPLADASRMPRKPEW